MSEGLAAVQARVDQLRLLVGGTAGAAPLGQAWSGSSASGAGGFSSSLAQLLGTASTDGTGTATGGTGAASGSLGTAAVSLARTYSGVPYLWGGTNPAKGLDCSGLVQLVYRKLGVELPRTSQQQQHSGTEVASLSQARPGDLVFFGEPAHHVGIYVGDGKMIDAPRTGKTVGVHAIAGYGTVSHIRRLGGGSSSVDSAALAGLSGGATTGRSGASLTGPYADLFTAAGTRYGVDPALLSAVAKVESGYNPRAVSGAGAQGLMQLMPGTARSLGVNPLRPAEAVDGAARLLAGHLRSYDGRVDLALAAYNAGPGAVNRYGGVPPYTETQTYVRRVTTSWEALR